MAQRREFVNFALVLAALVGWFFHDSLFLGKVLSPADVLFVQGSFPGKGAGYEAANRLLIDPVLQFQPWLAFNRAELRAGRLPLWNPYAGCGTPHLANAQSGVFDPIHVVAYLGSLPRAFAWMAALRLWIAGLGMFLLAGGWGLGRAARWFAGLAFPFCGFLVVWLQYPVTAAAIWLPWLLWASERLLERPSPRRVASVALFTALPCLAGHVQTAAHLLLASGLFVIWALVGQLKHRPTEALASGGAWAAGVALGVGLAAIQLVPLGAYLAESPVWADRLAERARGTTVQKPRLLDSLCTAFPYLYGSQRHGHPNVARALGVHNLNESAGGFAGTPVWLLLVPLGLARCRNDSRVRFFVILLALGFGLAFAIPPLPWLLDPLPVLNVIDHRRTTLWLALAQVALAAYGVDRLAAKPIGRIGLIAPAVLALVLAAAAVGLATQRDRIQARLEPWLAARATAAAPGDPGRIERHIRNAWRFYPVYFAGLAAELAALAGVVAASRGGRLAGSGPALALTLTALTLADLFAFGSGMNPEIDRGDAAPVSPVIERLRSVAPFPARILAIDGELPPNTLMRYGLCDLRDYDSIEIRSIVDHFEALYSADPAPGRTSRREVDWPRILHERARLIAADVRAIVSRTEPPEPLRAEAELVGAVWITRLGGPPPGYTHVAPGEIRIDASGDRRQGKAIPVTFDRGWKAEVDGRRIPIEASDSTFVSLDVPAGARKIRLRYEPVAVRVGAVLTGTSLLVWLGLGTGGRHRGNPGKSTSRAWRPKLAGDRIDVT